MSKSSRRRKAERRLASKMANWQKMQSVDAKAFVKPGSGK